VLPAAQRTKLFAMQKLIDSGYGYAYGWWMRQDADGRPRVIFHGGDFRGYHAEARWYPQTDITLVIATNDEFHGMSLAETILNHVVLILRGKSSPLPSVTTLSQERLKQYAGIFSLPWGARLDVSASDGCLEIRAEEPVGADLLADAHMDSAPERRAVEKRTLDLIARLKKDESGALADVLAPE